MTSKYKKTIGPKIEAAESAYRAQLAALEKLKCAECSGSGQCDDADCGGISYNTWTCTVCHGSGFAPSDPRTT